MSSYAYRISSVEDLQTTPNDSEFDERYRYNMQYRFIVYVIFVEVNSVLMSTNNVNTCRFPDIFYKFNIVCRISPNDYPVTDFLFNFIISLCVQYYSAIDW